MTYNLDGNSKEGKHNRYIADEIVKICQKQLLTSAQFKQPRITEILDNEDVNNFKLRPALQGRINIPFDSVFMSGFVDTLVAETEVLPTVTFEDPTGANMKGAKKITAAFERDKKTMRLKMKVRGMRKLSVLSGRAIAKHYAESDPVYKPYFDPVDYLDFHCEPNGGGHLDNHYFQGEENIFRTVGDLNRGAKSGWYDGEQVGKLVNAYSDPDFKKQRDEFANKLQRYATLGLDIESNNFIGGTLYNLAEWVTKHNGKCYHVIFDPSCGIWLRCVPIEQDFANKLAPWLSFAAPMEDTFNFWNLGPADKVKPVFEAIRVNLNEVLNNNRKRSWDMKAVDKNMFPDIKKLDWRQDGIVQASVPLTQKIQDGIYRFETPEISGALNLNVYLNNLAGEKLGGTPGQQGNANDQKVGIYQGNMLQISKKMKISVESVEEMFEDMAIRYDWNLWEHADEDEMVRLISTEGAGWEKITKEDKDPDYVVTAKTSIADKVEDIEEKKLRLDAIISTEKTSALFSIVNPRAHLEEKYRLMGFEEEKIKKMLNLKSDVTDEQLSEVKKAIELILEGAKVDPNWSITTGGLQYLSDWILENSEDIDQNKKAALEKYFDEHVPIAMKNAEQKQFNDELLAGTMAVKPAIPSNVLPKQGEIIEPVI